MFSLVRKEGLKMADIRITNSGIKTALKKFDCKKSIIEFIWNGFDAQATCVEINFKYNEMSGIEEITIKDNGYGIQKNKLDVKFVPFFDSEKIIDVDERRNISTVHGKNGVGRLTFFCFASNAQWETIYCDEVDNKNYKYSIEISDKSLNTYADSDSVKTTAPIGTTITFSNIHSIVSIEEIVEYIKKEFCWFLELNKDKNFKILIDGSSLDYSNFIADKTVYDLVYEKSNTKFSIKFIQWKEQLSQEYSKYYYIDSNNVERYKEYTTLNKKGDQFYHSIYIKSSIFNDFDYKNGEIQISFSFDKSCEEFKFVMANVNKLIRNKRRPFLKKSSEKLIDDFKQINAYPKFNDNNVIDIYRKRQLDDMIVTLYQAQPKIFNSLNDLQKKTFVHFLNLIMDSDEKENLFEILNEIIELDSDEKEELAKLLKYTRLSNIIRTIKLIEDRYKAVGELKCLVFNKEYHANEVNHLQKFIEKHYWLFGEQYNLVTAAEPDFEEALRRYTYILTDDKSKKRILHPHRNKEMDIFAIRQDFRNDIINNIVVELKHPDVKLRKKQYDQVLEYMDVILNQREFNAPNKLWEFYLVGNDYDEYIVKQLKNAEPHGERSLAYKVDNYKIYIKKWSEIITEFELRHNFLNEKMQLERDALRDSNLSSADDIIKVLNSNTAIQAQEIVIPK